MRQAIPRTVGAFGWHGNCLFWIESHWSGVKKMNMSQALSVPSAAVPSVPVVTTPGETAETAGSGLSFDQALADQLSTDDPVADVAGSSFPAAAIVLPPAGLAADGKELPLPLPPDLALPPAPAEPAERAITDLIAATHEIILPDAEAAAPVPQSLPGIPVVSPTPELTATDGHFSPGEVKPAVAPAADVARRSPAMPLPLQNAAETPSLAADGAREMPVGELIKNPGGEPEARAPARFDLASLTAAPSVPANAIASAAAGFTAAAPAPMPLTATVAVPLGQAQWGQALGQQVVWVMNQNVQGAELHLSPPELGPLSVRIHLDQDQASVSFVSAHAVVRDAVEAALPRLRDMFGAQGITLADVNVSHQQSWHAQRDSGGDGSARGPAARAGATGLETAAPVSRRIAAGMLDVYA